MHIAVTSEKKMLFPTSKWSDLHKELISGAARGQGASDTGSVVQAAASVNTQRRCGCMTGKPQAGKPWSLPQDNLLCAFSPGICPDFTSHIYKGAEL